MPATNWRQHDAAAQDSFNGELALGKTTSRKTTRKLKWTGRGPVDEDKFLSMQQELLETKKLNVDKDNKLRSLTAQLQRTEEAAKRALVMQHEMDQDGNLMPTPQVKRLMNASRILELEKEIQRLEAANRDLKHKRDRAVAELKDSKSKSMEYKARLDESLRDVRSLNLKIAKLEQSVREAKRSALTGTLKRTGGQDGFVRSEEEGRAFASKHDELMDEIEQLREELAHSKRGTQGDSSAANQVDQDEVAQLREELDQAKEQLGQLLAAGEARAAQGSGDAIEDWHLEEVTNGESGEVQLRDPESLVLFTNTRGAADWPRPLGRMDMSGRIPETQFATFMNRVAAVYDLGVNKLNELFAEVAGKSGKLDRGSSLQLLTRMYCVHCHDAESRKAEAAKLGDKQLALVYSLLDLNDDGDITSQEFQAGLRDCSRAWRDVRIGCRTAEQLQLESVLVSVVRAQKQDVVAQLQKAAIGPVDSTGNAEVKLADARKILMRLYPGQSTDTQLRMLMLMLLDWDFTGAGTIAVVDVLRLFRAVRLHKGISKGTRAIGDMATGPSAAAPGGGAGHQSARQLADAHLENSKLHDRIKALQTEVADCRAALRTWESELISSPEILDTLPRSGQPAIDKAIVELASKCKQYSEKYRELSRKEEAERSKNRELQEFADRKAEEARELTRQRHELEEKVRRVGFLEAELAKNVGALEKEQRARIDIERRLFEVDQGGNSDVDKLRSNIRDLERKLREAQATEYKLRKENESLISRTGDKEQDVQRQLDEEINTRKKVENEARALRDALHLRRTERYGMDTTKSTSRSQVMTISSGAREDQEQIDMSNVHSEVLEQELTKYKKLYEETHAENERVRAANGELQNGLSQQNELLRKENAALQARLDRCQQELEKLRILLKASKGGSTSLSAAAADWPAMECEDLKDGENLLEFTFKKADIEVGSDVSTFFTMEFYDQELQGSSCRLGPRPVYDTSITFKLKMDRTFFSYLAAHVLQLELNQKLGFDYKTIGRAALSLSQLLNDLKLDTMGPRLHTRNLPVLGPTSLKDGKLGFVTVTYRMLRPVLPFLSALGDGPSAPLAPQSNIFSRFASVARDNPSAASAIRVQVIDCTALRVVSSDAARPYVQIEFPGYDPIDTAAGEGRNPTFNVEHRFEFAPDPQTSQPFLDALRAALVTLVVYDAACDGDDAIVGVARVGLEALAGTERSLHNSFALTHPTKRAEHGRIRVLVEWAQVLSQVVATPPPPLPATSQDTKAAPLPLLDAKLVDDGETVIEVSVQTINVQAVQLPEDTQIIATFSFMNGKAVSTPPVMRKTPEVNYTLELRLPVNAALLEYLRSRSMLVEIHRLQRGAYSAELLGVAKVPLLAVLDAFCSGVGVGQRRFEQSYSITSNSAASEHAYVGDVRVGFRSLRCLREQRDALFVPAHGIAADTRASRRDEGEPRGGRRPDLSIVGATQEHAGAHEPDDAEGGAAVSTRISSDPAKWPADKKTTLILCLHSVALQHGVHYAHRGAKCQVFWLLAENQLAAHEEATTMLPIQGQRVDIGHTVLYNLRGSNPQQLAAQVDVRERLQRKLELAFGLVIHGPEGQEAHAVTPGIPLTLLMSSPEEQFKAVRLPFLCEATGDRIGELTATVVAQKVLRWLNAGAR